MAIHQRSFRSRTLAVLVAVAALGASALACAVPAESESEQVVAQGLTITRHDAEVFSGTFANAASLIRFSARVEGTGRASMRLEINKVVIDGTVDHVEKVLHWDAHDGSFTPADLDAMKELLAAWEGTFAGKRQEDLAVHEDFVTMRVAYYSAAPAGWPLGRHDVKASFHDESELPAPPSTVASGDDSEHVHATDQALACHVDGNNGITGLNCSTGYRWQAHDGAHCYSGFYKWSGPSDQWCTGKCGSNCGPLFTKGYTRDCLDHDSCISHDSPSGGVNPWDWACGDEWWEADEDYTFSFNTCWR